jgi:hypothetical protein
MSEMEMRIKCLVPKLTKFPLSSLLELGGGEGSEKKKVKSSPENLSLHFILECILVINNENFI